MTSYQVRSWGVARTKSGVCVEGLCVKTSVLWHSSEIIRRISSNILMTSSGNQYELVGPMSNSSCSEKYFTTSVLNEFENGFPENWKDLLERGYKNGTSTRKRDSGDDIEVPKNKRMRLDVPYSICFLTSSPLPISSPLPSRTFNKSKINKVYKSQLFHADTDQLNSNQESALQWHDSNDRILFEETNSQKSDPPSNIFHDVSMDVLAESFDGCEIDDLSRDGSMFDEPISKDAREPLTSRRLLRSNPSNHRNTVNIPQNLTNALYSQTSSEEHFNGNIKNKRRNSANGNNSKAKTQNDVEMETSSKLKSSSAHSVLPKLPNVLHDISDDDDDDDGDDDDDVDDDDDDDDDYSPMVIRSTKRNVNTIDDDSSSEDSMCAVEPSSMQSSETLKLHDGDNKKKSKVARSSLPNNDLKTTQKSAISKKTKVIHPKPRIVTPKKITTRSDKTKKKEGDVVKKSTTTKSEEPISSQNKSKETKSRGTKQSKKTAKTSDEETKKTKTAKSAATKSKNGKGKENLLEGHELLSGRPSLKKSRQLKKMMTEQLKSDGNGKDFLADMTQENIQDDDAAKVMAMFDGNSNESLGMQSNLTSSLFNRSTLNRSMTSSVAPSILNDTPALILTRSPENARDPDLEMFRLNKVMTGKKKSTKRATDTSQQIKKKSLVNKRMPELPDDVFRMEEGTDGDESEKDDYFSESEM